MLSDITNKANKARTPELICYKSTPESVNEIIHKLGIERHTLCVFMENGTDVTTVSDAYKQLGYRYLGKEALFILDTEQLIQYKSPAVKRITTLEEAELVARASRARQIFPQHLTKDDAVCRLYAAFEENTPVGWVRSIRTHPDCSWVSTLFVKASNRRNGIGSGLMSAMLKDDKHYGVRWSVLLASQAGAKLYPRLGYIQQGKLLIFSPVKTKSA